MKKSVKIAIQGVDNMTITYDQIPLIRMSAKKALSEGHITTEKYNQILQIIKELEQRKSVEEYKIQESIRTSLFSKTLSLT